MGQDRGEQQYTGGYSYSPVLPVGPSGIVAGEVVFSQGPGDQPEDKDPARVDSDLDAE